MTCRRVSDVIRAARDTGIQIERTADGNLRLRAAKAPPQAVVDHLHAHKPEIVAFLKAKAEAEGGERRIIVNARSPSVWVAGFGPNLCDRCGQPPTKNNPLIAGGMISSVHEKCFRGRRRRRPTYAPKVGGGGAAPVVDAPIKADNLRRRVHGAPITGAMISSSFEIPKGRDDRREDPRLSVSPRAADAGDRGSAVSDEARGVAEATRPDRAAGRPCRCLVAAGAGHLGNELYGAEAKSSIRAPREHGKPRWAGFDDVINY